MPRTYRDIDVSDLIPAQHYSQPNNKQTKVKKKKNRARHCGHSISSNLRMAGETMETVSNEQRAESRQKLEKWLNKSMRIKMTDGRTLVGIFLCTDSDCNIIMGSCEEYLKPVEHIPKEDPRILGLAMIPGKHVVSIEIDETLSTDEEAKLFEKSSYEVQEVQETV